MSLHLRIEIESRSAIYAAGEAIAARVVLTNRGDKAVQVPEIWLVHLTISFFPVGERAPLPIGPPGIPPAGGFPDGTRSLGPGDSVQQSYRDLAFMLAHKPLAPGEYRVEATYAGTFRLFGGPSQVSAEPVKVIVEQPKRGA